MSDFADSAIEALWVGTIVSGLLSAISAQWPKLGLLIGALLMIGGLVSSYRLYLRHKVVHGSVIGALALIFGLAITMAPTETLVTLLPAFVVFDVVFTLFVKAIKK